MLNVGLERKHAQNTRDMASLRSAFALEMITKNIRNMSRAEIPLVENMPTLFTKSMTETPRTASKHVVKKNRFVLIYFTSKMVCHRTEPDRPDFVLFKIVEYVLND